MLKCLQLQLCDIQGRVFELSLKKGYDSRAFIEAYMNSETAAFLDKPYDRMQWSGEEYILESLSEEGNGLQKSENLLSREMMYWTGYIYRYWHFLTGESSKEIYQQADWNTMKETYLGFHTLDNTMAVENLKEIYRQKKENISK